MLWTHWAGAVLTGDIAISSIVVEHRHHLGTGTAHTITRIIIKILIIIIMQSTKAVTLGTRNHRVENTV
jgi:hypothetical protein